MNNWNSNFFANRFAVVPIVWALATVLLSAQNNRIVSLDREGRLAYEVNERGDQVPDFSYCGYAGGNLPIPDAPVKVVVEPRPGDSTARIQKAIDYVSSLPEDANGLRGSILLMKGRHQILGGLEIGNSGVVLRGQGMGIDGTVLVAAGLDRRTLIRIVGVNNKTVRPNADWMITDDYVPVGARSFHVRNAGELRPGDSIEVVRPSTQEWIEALGMVHFGGEDGFRWKPGSRDIVWERRIETIEGNQLFLDAPITTALDAKYGGGHVETFSWPGRISQVGIENLQLISDCDPTNPKDENHSWMAITMENVENAWVRQVTFKHFAGSAVALYESSKWVTVEDCLSLQPVSENGGYRRHTFFTMGQMTLFVKCYAENGRHDFAVGHCAAGPNAFVQCDAHLPLADSGGIESWASGILYDNVRIDGNAITLGNQARMNQDAGWAAANSVVWQCSAAMIRCYNPPTAQNWAFGAWAGFEGDGIWRSQNDFISPDSLYAGQLEDRLGSMAAEQLQLMPRPHEESSNPPIERAQELAAASHVPAPLLPDYIAHAAVREPIPSEPDDAVLVDALPDPARGAEVSESKLVITNGWITCDGKLLIGGSASVQWWRGNIRPEEAPSFGIGLTRFVPGRSGRGFTDYLSEVADSMQASGQAAMDYNYGLWYDRRRDDHERVRRMDGDVCPPLYEQPFARSGQGSAWEGLSQYDLTKYNPWYWSRLREFAEVCDQRGLVLFNQNYFQHNILEAGAHWADFPWRSANNINNTGFPEPPPYAGDKRIFQAELFYDIDHPVRRKLHEAYIRQCLNNFANNANVIQFTSGEFTGPLHFVQFWLDTIAAWETENPLSKPTIALSCTKDVQDAILAEPKRSQVVDVIDFRYWWQTDTGEFAPPGGKNLAPRQFERQWRGGRPNDSNLAEMASEYRSRFPEKALICDFNPAGWAWVCAGGSLPRLPRTTDAGLLAAIPNMKPWAEVSNDGLRVLREPGKQLLVYSAGRPELDLAREAGSFRLLTVNPKTGEVKPGDKVSAGGKVNLPDSPIVWLISD